MILAIDVGNTQLVAGCMQNGRSVVSARFETNTRSTAAEYAIKFKIWLEMNNVSASQIEGGIISTVVPPLASVLRETFRMLCGKEPVVVGPGVRTGLNIKIDNPAQLGADIVAGTVASIAKYPLPQIVFDMGTATTACVIDAAGVLRGVVILPGVRTALSTLVEKTSQLPNIDLIAPKHVVGTNTVDSMLSGTIYGTAATMDGIARRIEKEIGEEATLIATGGLSKAIVPYCERSFIQDDNLVLDGLYRIYQKNRIGGDRG